MSECSATAAAELAGKMADIDVVDSRHGDGSLPADKSLADAAEADFSDKDVNTVQDEIQQLVEKQLDAEDTVIQSPDEDTEEGMYHEYKFICLHFCSFFCISFANLYIFNRLWLCNRAKILRSIVLSTTPPYREGLIDSKNALHI